MTEKTLIQNVQTIIYENDDIQHADITLSGGKISKISRPNQTDPTGCFVVDGKGRFLLPGKIHPGIQVPYDITSDSMKLLSQSLILSGITSFIAIPTGDENKNFSKVLEECGVNFSHYFLHNSYETHRLIEVEPCHYGGIFLDTETSEEDIDWVLANIRGCPIAIYVVNEESRIQKGKLAQKNDTKICIFKEADTRLIYYATQRILQQYRNKTNNLFEIAASMAENIAREYNILGRGSIQEGLRADLNLTHIDQLPYNVSESSPYKSAWNPPAELNVRITHTWINGILVAKNGHILNHNSVGEKLLFQRN